MQSKQNEPKLISIMPINRNYLAVASRMLKIKSRNLILLEGSASACEPFKAGKRTFQNWYIDYVMVRDLFTGKEYQIRLSFWEYSVTEYTR